MFEGQVAYYFLKSLGSILQGLDADSSRISVGRGEVESRSNSLRPEGQPEGQPEGHNLPDTVKADILGRRTLKDIVLQSLTPAAADKQLTSCSRLDVLRSSYWGLRQSAGGSGSSDGGCIRGSSGGGSRLCGPEPRVIAADGQAAERQMTIWKPQQATGCSALRAVLAAGTPIPRCHIASFAVNTTVWKGPGHQVVLTNTNATGGYPLMLLQPGLATAINGGASRERGSIFRSHGGAGSGNIRSVAVMSRAVRMVASSGGVGVGCRSSGGAGCGLALAPALTLSPSSGSQGAALHRVVSTASCHQLCQLTHPLAGETVSATASGAATTAVSGLPATTLWTRSHKVGIPSGQDARFALSVYRLGRRDSVHASGSAASALASMAALSSAMPQQERLYEYPRTRSVTRHLFVALRTGGGSKVSVEDPEVGPRSFKENVEAGYSKEPSESAKAAAAAAMMAARARVASKRRKLAARLAAAPRMGTCRMRKARATSGGSNVNTNSSSNNSSNNSSNISSRSGSTGGSSGLKVVPNPVSGLLPDLAPDTPAGEAAKGARQQGGEQALPAKECVPMEEPQSSVVAAEWGVMASPPQSAWPPAATVLGAVGARMNSSGGIMKGGRGSGGGGGAPTNKPNDLMWREASARAAWAELPSYGAPRVEPRGAAVASWRGTMAGERRAAWETQPEGSVLGLNSDMEASSPDGRGGAVHYDKVLQGSVSYCASADASIRGGDKDDCGADARLSCGDGGGAADDDATVRDGADGGGDDGSDVSSDDDNGVDGGAGGMYADGGGDDDDGNRNNGGGSFGDGDGGSHSPGVLEVPALIRGLSALQAVEEGPFSITLQGTWQECYSVVVKVLTHGEECSYTLNRVCQLWSQLAHPNIVTCGAVDTFPAAVLESVPAMAELIPKPTSASTGLQTWLVLERCENGSLAALLAERYQLHQAARVETEVETDEAESDGDSRCGRSGDGDCGNTRDTAPFPGLLTVAEVLSIAQEVAWGLSYLRSLDMYHGDVRAENIMIQTVVLPSAVSASGNQADEGGMAVPSCSADDDSGGACIKAEHQDFCSSGPLVVAAPSVYLHRVAKLTEPGVTLARMLAGCAGGPWTPEAVEALGTTSGSDVSHVPPELLLTGQLQPSSDVYSLGFLLWRMLSTTGEAPYSNHRAVEVAYKVVGCGMRPSLPPAVPEPLRCLVEECWQSDPEARPTAYEVLQRVTELQVHAEELQNHWRERHSLFRAVVAVPVSAVAMLPMLREQHEMVERWAEAAGIELRHADAARSSSGQSGAMDAVTLYKIPVGPNRSVAHLYQQPPAPTPPTSAWNFVNKMREQRRPPALEPPPRRASGLLLLPAPVPQPAMPVPELLYLSPPRQPSVMPAPELLLLPAPGLSLLPTPGGPMLLSPSHPSMLLPADPFAMQSPAPADAEMLMEMDIDDAPIGFPAPQSETQSHTQPHAALTHTCFSSE
ncbi:hypothetical protein Vafri_15442 [Volvox africanus]|uniref:Protein kinase domain-containing protein n=1 Tax=Volvox africanus TaxID=51714 RepID=A0A8J4BLD5_9CHLO|nr:hypothetical protein Vafri_15442 [Volvox africanus]